MADAVGHAAVVVTIAGGCAVDLEQLVGDEIESEIGADHVGDSGIVDGVAGAPVAAAAAIGGTALASMTESGLGDVGQDLLVVAELEEMVVFVVEVVAELDVSVQLESAVGYVGIADGKGVE